MIGRWRRPSRQSISSTIGSPGSPSMSTCGWAQGEPRGQPARGSRRGCSWAAVRANQREGFLFIINHEANAPETTVHLGDLPFRIGTITDLGTGQPVAFTTEGQDRIKLDFSVPLGEVLLCLPAPEAKSGNDATGESTSSPFSLWQLPNQTPTQMMSYVIRSPNGKVIVIDGGNAGDTRYLADFLKGHGNTVDAWFISHAHSDHFDALGEILKQPDSLKITALYASIPRKAWMGEYLPTRAPFPRLRFGL